MINGSFVFGMDGDDASVFERTVEWAIEQGIETATFHILTPYPGTALYRRMRQGRITVHDWDLYDTRHAVFRPARMTADELERGYWRAYRDFYRWGSIVRGAAGARRCSLAGLRHVAYAAGWKKFEPLWDLVIRAKRAGHDAAGARDDPQRVRQAAGLASTADTQAPAPRNAVGTPDPLALLHIQGR